jgi:hypothetical protein
LIAIFTTSAITFTPNWNLNPKIRVFTQQKGNYDSVFLRIGFSSLMGWTIE